VEIAEVDNNSFQQKSRCLRRYSTCLIWVQ